MFKKFICRACSISLAINARRPQYAARRVFASKPLAKVSEGDDDGVVLDALRRMTSSLKTWETANEVVRIRRMVRSRQYILSPTDRGAFVKAHAILRNWDETICLYESLKLEQTRAGTPTRPFEHDKDVLRCAVLAYCKTRHLKGALNVLRDMLAWKIEPGPEIYSSLITAYIGERELPTALRLERQMKDRGMKLGAAIYGSIVAGRTDANRFTDARRDQMYAEMKENGISPESNSEYLLSLVTSYVNLSRNEHAIGVLKRMKRESTEAESLVKAYNAIIKGTLRDGAKTSGIKGLAEGERWFAEMKSFGLKPNVVTYSLLMHSHYRFAGMARVLKYYDEMRRAGIQPDQTVYNILIRAHVLDEKPDVSIALFEEMISRGIQPNLKTLTSLITSLTLTGNMELAEKAFEEVAESGVNADHRLYHVIINGYANALNLSKTLEWYNRLLASGLRPTTITYTIIMYAVSGRMDAEKFSAWYERIFSSEVKPNVHTYTLLMNKQNRLGNLTAVRQIFDDMVAAGVDPDIKAYSTLMLSMIENSAAGDAIRVLDQMLLAGKRPDRATYHVIMRMFTTLKQPGEVIKIFEGLRAQDIDSDDYLDLTAFGAYIELRNIDAAKDIIDSISKRANKECPKLPPNILGSMVVRLLHATGNAARRKDMDVKDLEDMLGRIMLDLEPGTFLTDSFKRVIKAAIMRGKPELALYVYLMMASADKATKLPADVLKGLFRAFREAMDVERFARTLGISMVAARADEHFEGYVTLMREIHKKAVRDGNVKVAQKQIYLSWKSLGETITSLIPESERLRDNRALTPHVPLQVLKEILRFCAGEDGLAEKILESLDSHPASPVDEKINKKGFS
ncbi:hypothetical protein HK101_010541 [Irineochytrium annulatum]|nr:hypothetical protein HK101_010541 [Irineochytrium annulatum]